MDREKETWTCRQVKQLCFFVLSSFKIRNHPRNNRLESFIGQVFLSPSSFFFNTFVNRSHTATWQWQRIKVGGWLVGLVSDWLLRQCILKRCSNPIFHFSQLLILFNKLLLNKLSALLFPTDHWLICCWGCFCYRTSWWNCQRQQSLEV